MNEPHPHGDQVLLANECTVEDIRQWLNIGGKALAQRGFMITEQMRASMQVLLEALWEGDEPALSPHELAMLMSLPERMGTTAEDPSVQEAGVRNPSSCRFCRCLKSFAG